MTLVCNQCSRVNPADASYCYFDGVRLAGAGGGPINAATQDFPNQFVFPSGQGCRNFDQLALTCQQQWSAAVELLKGGLFASFFGGLGRADLAMAAQEAARFPDLDRGLDQLLAKLPSQALQNPKIQVEPSDINLGQIPVGTDRTIELNLSNQGMRLLYGSIASDCKWLTLGDAPGQAQKLFQFGAETTIPVLVRGQHLRAATKPMEGQLLIESNGGNSIINVRATVPIVPCKEGVLAGSLTPRQICEKAKANPDAAAPLFEKGAVAAWFKSNGWIYPVQGPSAMGRGAVQQFFEALGVAKAPKVEINTQSLNLKGDPGKSVQATLEVSSPEKKLVYAYATCEQAWVDVSKVKLGGRLATITVNIPSIPARPGETLKTNIHVAGNGNQRFTVPLTLAITGTPGSTAPPPGPVEDPFATLGTETPAPVSDSPFGGFYAGSTPIAPADASAAGSGQTPVVGSETRPSRKSREHVSPWAHLLPLGILFLVLAGLVLRDLLATAPPPPASVVNVENTDVEKEPRLAILFDYKPGAPDKEGYYNELNFGMWQLNTGGEPKKLFFAERGTSNTTMLKVDDTVSKFGKPRTGRGEWLSKPRVKSTEAEGTWVIDNVHFTQKVKLIPGEPVDTGDKVYKRYWDTGLVTYRIENKDIRTHVVGMRIMLDTYIGDNDGVPFTIPGMQGLMSTCKEFKGADVPDFVTALENSSLEKPGTIVQLNLRFGEKLDPPDRVQLTRWPGEKAKGFKSIEQWEVPLLDIARDSSVVMYWNPEKLDAGKVRELGYTYGLGSLESKGGQLALTVGGSFVIGGEISVVALASSAKGEEKVTLTLPKDNKLTLVSGNPTQAVPAPHKDADGKLRPSPVTWRIKAQTDGVFDLQVNTTTGAVQTKRIIIRKSSIF